MSRKTKKFFSCKNVDEGGRMGDSYEGSLGLDGLVANEGKRSIGNVGNGSGNGQHGSRSSRMLRRISSIGWGGGEVPGGIGTYPVDSMCLTDPFPARRCSVRRL